MDAISVQRLLSLVEEAASGLGQEATLKQLMAFLLVARSGADGVDGTTVEKRLDASQAATSRTLKMLGPTLGLVEFFLDQSDGRRRLARLSPEGRRFAKALVNKA